MVIDSLLVLHGARGNHVVNEFLGLVNLGLAGMNDVLNVLEGVVVELAAGAVMGSHH